MTENRGTRNETPVTDHSALTDHSADRTAASEPRRRHRRLCWTVPLLLVLAVGAGAVWYLSDQTDAVDPGSAQVFNTDVIEVRDLAETTGVSGTLAYDDELVVAAPISGVVAYIPADGAVLERGDRLFAVDSMVSDSQLTAAEQRIASAQASLANAEIALEDLESGASPADLSSAEAAVAQSRLTLDRLLEAPTPAEVGAAEAAVARAQQAYDDLVSVPTPAEVDAAEAAVARAQQAYDDLVSVPTPAEVDAAEAAVARAQQAYDDLIAEPDPTDLAEADAAIQQAEQRLSSARAGRDLSLVSLETTQDEYCDWTDRAVRSLCGDLPLSEAQMVTLTDGVAQARGLSAEIGSPSTEQDWADLSEDYLDANLAYIAAVSDHDSAVVALDTAYDARADLVDGPSSVDVESASANVATASEALADLLEEPSPADVDNALANVATASEALAELLEEPTPADVDNALANLETARERLQELQDDPDPLEVAHARASLASAQNRLDDLSADPDNTEMLRAASNVSSAALSLDAAQADYDDLLAGAETAYLFYGAGAAWRDLSVGVEPGPDVAWLETNLAALGYSGLQVDEVFDTATADAVMAWQADIGVLASGEVEFGQLVFASGPALVSAVEVERGDTVTAQTPLYELTAVELVSSTVGPNGVVDRAVTAQRVTARLDLVDQDLLDVGTRVLIELPDDTELDGEVIEIGATAVIVAATSQSDESAYLDVVIAPVQAVDPSWTGATVQVEFATEVAQGVLSVPVSALLALQEGGYAVEVVQADGSLRLVGVSTGLFADGFVEISGSGLAPEVEVVVP